MRLSAEERAAFERRQSVAPTWSAALDEQLCALLAASVHAWPGVRVDRSTFLTYLGERVAVEDLGRVVAADLYLACAWLDGDQTAHAALESGPFREATHVLLRFDTSADAIAEAQQSARAILFARDKGHAGLAGYRGRGPLRAWLGVTLARELLQLIRKQARLRPLASDELVALVDDDGDPETRYFRTVYGDELRRAMSDALRTLDSADKRLLRYSLVDRLTIDDLSALSGIHRATAARRLAAARDRLIARAHDLIKERLRVDTVELASILRVCDRDLDVSVQRLLKEGSVG